MIYIYVVWLVSVDMIPTFPSARWERQYENKWHAWVNETHRDYFHQWCNTSGQVVRYALLGMT